MLDDEIITNQNGLLIIYRRTLQHLLLQAAHHGGESAAPVQVANAIYEARANIRYIKAGLRNNGVPVQDIPGDDDPLLTLDEARNGQGLKQQEILVASDLITFLEDRRVLYELLMDQVDDYALASVKQIRETLGEALAKVSRDSDVAKLMREMQSVCRKFLTVAQSHQGGDVQAEALREFRAVSLHNIRQIATLYQVEVTGELFAILSSSEQTAD